VSAPVETCRGVVQPWECDVSEHFTIACYFARIAQASAVFRTQLAGPSLPHLAACRYDARFRRELRVGEGLHVESGVIEARADALRIGHRLLHSATGEVAAWFEERLAPTGSIAAALEPLGARRIAWDGPGIEVRPEPAGTSGFMLAARDRVRPQDLDETGHLALEAAVHRFSAAGLQALAAMGMDAAYMAANRRGYSTFEVQLRLASQPGMGTGIDVRTAIVHLGNSSLRLLHRMLETESGREIATQAQFGVHLDLDARRPTPLPETLRTRAAKLLVKP